MRPYITSNAYWIGFQRGINPRVRQRLPFKLRDDFLSNAEISFCQVLRSVVWDRAVVCPKVNLGDMFFVTTGDHRKNRALANRVDRKHADFLLCEPNTMRPVLGIELDARSHDREDRQAREQLVEAVFNAAGLPLLRFALKSVYAPTEIESQVMRHVLDTRLRQRTRRSPPAVPVSATPDSAPACPKCGSKMILHTAKSGANAGGQFWDCSNFPRCRSVLPFGQKPDNAET